MKLKLEHYLLAFVLLICFAFGFVFHRMVELDQCNREYEYYKTRFTLLRGCEVRVGGKWIYPEDHKIGKQP